MLPDLEDDACRWLSWTAMSVYSHWWHWLHYIIRHTAHKWPSRMARHTLRFTTSFQQTPHKWPSRTAFLVGCHSKHWSQLLTKMVHVISHNQECTDRLQHVSGVLMLLTCSMHKATVIKCSGLLLVHTIKLLLQTISNSSLTFHSWHHADKIVNICATLA